MLQRLRAKGIPWPAPLFFHRRLLMCAALLYAAGIVISGYVPYGWYVWAGTAGVAALGVLLWKFRQVARVLLMAFLLLLGTAQGGMARREPPLPDMGKWTVEGTIQGEVTYNERAVMFFLRDVRVQAETDGPWVPIQGNMYCYCPTTARLAFAHGQRVTVAGSSYLPTGARNPGAFDQRMWMAQKGAHVRLYATSAPVMLEAAGFSPLGAALSINAALGARMDAVFGQASPVVRAMLLGDQRGMPDQWSDWMSSGGIAHLMAVSGLHVALWYAMLARILKPMPVSPAVRWGLLAALLCIYATITGLRPSVLRAVVMLLAVQGGHVAKRKPDPLTNLSLAALAILLFRPLDLFGAGFQLSFSAVLGIVLLRPPLKRLLPARPTWAAEGVCTSLAAQLGILPASSHWFGTVSIVGIAANLVAIPVAGLLVPVAALGLALDALWAPLGWLLVQASRGMVAGLLLLSRAASGTAFSVARIGAFPWWFTIIFFLCMLLCSTAVVWRWRWRALAMTALITAGIAASFFSGMFLVRYVQLDVGQALAGVLHVGRGTYVYDTGDRNSDLTEYLMYTGRDVDGLFLSHPHMDHIGGLAEVLDKGIHIRTLYVPAKADVFGAEAEYEALLARAQAQGAEVVELEAGDVLDLRGVQATVIAPTREVTRGNDPNDRSIVLLLEIGHHLLMLMGDADGPAEPLGVDTDVLQVAHHGSRNAARDKFLSDATPDIALISVGRNSYGHPHEETLARLEAAGADIYITKETGAITLYFGGDDIRVEAYAQ